MGKNRREIQYIDVAIKLRWAKAGDNTQNPFQEKAAVFVVRGYGFDKVAAFRTFIRILQKMQAL